MITATRGYSSVRVFSTLRQNSGVVAAIVKARQIDYGAQSSTFQVNVRTMSSVPQLIQEAMTSVHTLTGTPWWATIATSTIFLRFSLVPLVRQQIVSSRKLSAAVPEINFLFQLLRQRLQSIPGTDVSEKRKVVSVFFQGVNACFKLHDISVTEFIAYPLINMSIFITFVYSVRDLVINGSDVIGLENGGLLWFTDLSFADKTYVLPLTALGTTYLSLETAFSMNNGRVVLFFKDTAQSLLLLSIPMVATLPAGVFCYWLPSSLFAISQTLFLRTQAGNKLLRLPKPIAPSHISNGQKVMETASTTMK